MIDHRVDGVLELEDLTLDVDGDLLREVALGYRGGHVGNVAHLAGQVAGHEVDVVGQVLPGARDAFHVRLATELTLGAYLACHARHLGGEGAELVHHRVDGLARAQELTLERPPIDLQRHALRQVASGHGADDAVDLRRRLGQIIDQGIDRIHAPGPRSVDWAQRGALPHPTLAAHHDGDARELFGHLLIEVDHVVEGLRDVPSDPSAIEWQAYLKIAIADTPQGCQQSSLIENIHHDGRLWRHHDCL